MTEYRYVRVVHEDTPHVTQYRLVGTEQGNATAAGYVPPTPTPPDSPDAAALRREIRALRLKYGHLPAFRKLVREGLLGETVVDLDE